jgi:hypothetical protein
VTYPSLAIDQIQPVAFKASNLLLETVTPFERNRPTKNSRSVLLNESISMQRRSLVLVGILLLAELAVGADSN